MSKPPQTPYFSHREVCNFLLDNASGACSASPEELWVKLWRQFWPEEIRPLGEGPYREFREIAAYHGFCAVQPDKTKTAFMALDRYQRPRQYMRSL